MHIEDYKNLFKDENFIASRNNKEICLFIGAGVGYNIGMPSWNGLAFDIIQFCLKENIFNHSYSHTLEKLNDPLKIITFCEKEIQKKGKEDAFDSHLKEIFIKLPFAEYNKKKNSIYKNIIKICQSQKALIVQTNYDSVIETKSIENSNCNLQAYIPFLENAGNIKDFKNYIIYLHGKIENKHPTSAFHYEDLILTRKQYNDVYVIDNPQNDKFEKQKAFFKNLLKNYYIIFLGYSLQDVEIVQLIANKGESKIYKEIKVIIDECDAKKHLNQIDAEYLIEASNGKIKPYIYSTEKLGFKAFEKVIKDISKVLLKEPEPSLLPTSFDEVIING